MIRIVYGNEPYIIEMEKQHLVSAIKNPEMNLLKATSMTEDVSDFLFTYPVMDERRLAILDVDTVSMLDCKEFRQYFKRPSEYGDLFIIVRKFEKTTKFAKELIKSGVVRECNKLTDKDMLVNCLLSVIKKAEGRITGEAMNEFVARENYMETEINLLHMVNDLNGLLAIDKDITLPMVQTYIRKNEAENCFALAKMIAGKNFKALQKQADLIGSQSSEVIRVLSLLLREYRIAWKLKVVKGFKTKYCVFKDYPRDEIFNGLTICQEAIDSAKLGKMPTEELMRLTLMRLALNHK